MRQPPASRDPRRPIGALVALAAGVAAALVAAPGWGAIETPAPPPDRAEHPNPDPPAAQPAEPVAEAQTFHGRVSGSVTCTLITLDATGFPPKAVSVGYAVTLDGSATPLAQGTWSFTGPSASTTFPWSAPRGESTVHLRWERLVSVQAGSDDQVIATAHQSCCLL